VKDQKEVVVVVLKHATSQCPKVMGTHYVRLSMTELGFHVDRARPVLFLEFSFKRSVVSGPEFLVPRVFFQKICGFRARVC